MRWHCWLGGRKGIRPVKTEWWGAGVVVWSEVQTCIWPSGFNCHSLSVASVKSRLVLPFWYRLNRVVPDKGSINGCVCVCVYLGKPSVLWQCWLGIRKSIWSVQEAQHSPSNRATRRVSWNLANYHAKVQKLLVRQVLNKSKLWR